MPVYAKRLNGRQRKCAREYEQICGFEFMHQDDIDVGTVTFNEAWDSNIRWLEDVVAEVISINTSGARK